uniref:Phytochrome A-associated F-box protein n=1 Tax=Kalanchoe fedtschenkoi TaxID=63787 RepID=A0A7N0T7F4_KALFE
MGTEKSDMYGLPDDVLLNILVKLEDDPRHLPRLACVATRFAHLIRFVCWRNKCYASIPDVVSDLLSSHHDSSAPAGGWPSLHKLAVCCPGLLHSGVLLDNSDFGLDRELGPDHSFPLQPPAALESASASCQPDLEVAPKSTCAWSLYDDLYMDTVYDSSEFKGGDEVMDPNEDEEEEEGAAVIKAGCDASSVCKKTKLCRSMRSHLASGIWNLSREQGNKLLASRFRGDCLYICDWPGCVHIEEKRNYMLFRGIFKDFKRSRVWRTINDGNRRSKLNLNCAFCPCKETWDLHSAFCLRRVYGYHDDGEPVVRAYVCENGHVSGAWTDWPLYT